MVNEKRCSEHYHHGNGIDITKSAVEKSGLGADKDHEAAQNSAKGGNGVDQTGDALDHGLIQRSNENQINYGDRRRGTIEVKASQPCETAGEPSQRSPLASSLG